MQSLFPQQRPGAAGGRGGPEPAAVISFKAGKMILSPDRETNGKFQITADKRRGKIELAKGTDGLMHFRWVDRTSGRREDDRIVMPDDITFKKCKTGRENDRVYLLKFRGGQQPLMFWMQEKSNEKDADNVSKLNEYANNPAAAAAAMAAAAPVAVPAGVPGFPGMTPEQWAQMMGLPPPTATAPAAADAATAAVAAAPTGALANLDLSSLFGNLGGTTGATGATPAHGGLASSDLQRAMMGLGSPGTGGQGQGDRVRPPALQEIVTSEAVINSGILNDPAVRASLIEHLPESQQSDEFLEDTIRSPQFRQSLGALSSALQSENFNSVMANFGIDPNAGMSQLIRGDGVGAFVTALQADEDRRRGSDSGHDHGHDHGHSHGHGGSCTSAHDHGHAHTHDSSDGTGSGSSSGGGGDHGGHAHNHDHATSTPSSNSSNTGGPPEEKKDGDDTKMEE